MTHNEANGISSIVIGVAVLAWSRWGLPYLLGRTRERFVQAGRDTLRIDAGLDSRWRWGKTAVTLAGTGAVAWGLVLLVG